MLVYLGGFFASCFILALIERWPSSSVGYWFWSAVALLIPCLIAGLRAETIGTDVLEYVKPLFLLADDNRTLAGYYDDEWWRLWRYEGPGDFEPGFAVLIWVVTRLTGSLSAVLFAIQALTIVPIYLALVHERGRSPVWFGMAVYYLLFFNSTLNLMRQWIAMAILLYALRFLDDKRPTRYLVAIVAAALFHKVALFGVLVLVVHAFLERKVSADLRGVAVIVMLGLALLACAGLVSSLLARFGFANYAAYIGTVELSPLQLALRLPSLVLLLACWKGLAYRDSRAVFFVGAAVLDVTLGQLGASTTHGVRMALLFGEYQILSLPAAYTAIRDRSNKLGFGLVVWTYLLTYWVLVYGVLGTMETVPYESVIWS